MSTAAPLSENAQQPPLAGLLARFDGPAALVAAAARLRQEGFQRFDALSPFPIHGMDRAMGIRPTRLPWLVLGAAWPGRAARSCCNGGPMRSTTRSSSAASPCSACRPTSPSPSS